MSNLDKAESAIMYQRQRRAEQRADWNWRQMQREVRGVEPPATGQDEMINIDSPVTNHYHGQESDEPPRRGLGTLAKAAIVAGVVASGGIGAAIPLVWSMLQKKPDVVPTIPEDTDTTSGIRFAD